MATEMATESEPASAAEAVKQSAPPATGTKRWYVVHAYSGMEKGVARALQERINRAGLQSQFGQILVPVEEVVEVKGGKKSITERRANRRRWSRLAGGHLQLDKADDLLCHRAPLGTSAA